MTEKEKQDHIAKLAKSTAPVEGAVIDGRLVLSLPWDPQGTKSASGKTTVHASTRGNRPLTLDGKDGPNEVNAGVNVYSK